MPQCANGCTLTVHAERDSPNDPIYPVVVCHKCLTRWFGHRENREDAKVLDPRLPAALRDAILLDQADRAFEILEELGYKQAVRPNALLGLSSGGTIAPGQTAQFFARPQCEEFTPTHFVTGVDGFLINDVRIGNRSQFLQSEDIPSEAFRMNISVGDLILHPGDKVGSAQIDIPAREIEGLPMACSAFQWDRCLTAMDIVVVATNVSGSPVEFRAWLLGIQRSSRSAQRAGRFLAVAESTA